MASEMNPSKVLEAGPGRNRIFVPTLRQDANIQLEQDVQPSELRPSEQAALARHIMALANGYSFWGERRYLVIGANAQAELADGSTLNLDNATLQEIVSRYCQPAVPCYYQEQRIRGQRVGMIVISDSATKPFAFAANTPRQSGLEPGQVWLAKDGIPQLATPEEARQIGLDAALVKPAPLEITNELAAADQQIDPSTLAGSYKGWLWPHTPTPLPSWPLPHANQLAQIALDTNLLVLCGAPGTGKRAVIEMLSANLAATTGYQIWHALWAHEDMIPALRQGPARLVQLYDAEPRQLADLAALSSAAQASGSILLITTTATGQEWPNGAEIGPSLIEMHALVDDQYLCDLLRACMEDIRPALTRQGYLLDEKNIRNKSQIIGKELCWIATQLGSPGAINRFVQTLSQRSLEGESQLLHAITQARELDRVLDWFWSLDFHERYFVLAVIIFGQLPKPVFWHWYEDLVANSWRDHEPNLRTIPGINAKLGEWLTADLGFRHPQVPTLILDAALTQYQRPLIWALPLLEQAVIQLGGATTQATRISLGTIQHIVSSLSESQWTLVQPLLTSWSTQHLPAIRSIAAQVLAYGYDSQQTAHSRILSLMQGWANDMGIEEGWVPPRHAYRVRCTAALAMGYSYQAANTLADRAAIRSHLRKLARDPHPRVREAVAIACRQARHLPHTAGILGVLANDPSARVRSQTALALANAGSEEQPVGDMIGDILTSWSNESDGARATTAHLAMLMLCQRRINCEQFLSHLASHNGLAAMDELSVPDGSDIQPLIPLLSALAAHPDATAQEGAMRGLLSLARKPNTRDAVQQLVSDWEGQEDEALAETASRWQSEWAKWRSSHAHDQLCESTVLPDVEPLESKPNLGPAVELSQGAAAGLPKPPSGHVAPGPQPWRRPAVSDEQKRREHWAKIGSFALRAVVAIGITLAASAILRRFPYYDNQWTPFFLLVCFGASYAQASVGVAATLLISLLPLLYHAPVLVPALLLLIIALAALGNAIGQERRAIKHALVLAFPLLATTWWALLLPFLIGWWFRKRGSALVLLGLLFTMVVGIVLGQPLVGDYVGVGLTPEASLVLERSAPENWQRFDWLLNVEILSRTSQDLITLGTSLFKAFTNTPFALVQLGLWVLVAWLTSWAIDRENLYASLAALAAIAIGLYLAYGIALIDVLQLEPPFTADTTTLWKALLGSAIVAFGVYGWPRIRLWLDRTPWQSTVNAWLKNLTKRS